jgi:hypothetical protein
MELETLTTEVKIMALESTVTRLETDIYRCCILLGLDPATIDPATYSYETPVIRHESVTIRQSLDSLVSVKNELQLLKAI